MTFALPLPFLIWDWFGEAFSFEHQIKRNAPA